MRSQTIVIVSGIGRSGVTKTPFSTQPSPRAARKALVRIRSTSTAHWAYLEISGHRVDDDRIPVALETSRA